MKIVYLLSGPSKNKSFSEDLKSFMKNDLENKKSITFIASSPDNHDKNMMYVYGNESIMGIVKQLGEIHTFDKVNIIDSSNISENDLLSSDVIYLLGGDPTSQYNFIKDNKLNLILDSYQGVIIGTSCGAMNLANKAYYSKDDEVDESYFYDGFSIVDITVDPHFDYVDEDRINENKKMSLINKIYAFDDDSGIRVTNNEVQLIGRVDIFDKGNIINKTSRIK